MYLDQMASNTGTCSVSITLSVPFPSMDRIRALLLLLSSVPHSEPWWSSSCTLGSQVMAERQTPGPALMCLPMVSPCAGLGARVYWFPFRWSHMCILPRYGSPHNEPVSFPGRDLLPSLLCSYLTPGWLSLPQRLPYVVLPLTSPYV